MTLDGWADQVFLEGSVTSEDRESVRQLHMLGCLRALHAAMSLLCVMSVLTESSHFRGVLVLAECIFFGIATMDAYTLGLQYQFPAAFATIALIGVMVHNREPGVFTTDKASKSKQQ